MRTAIKRLVLGSAVTTTVLVVAATVADAAPKFHALHK